MSRFKNRELKVLEQLFRMRTPGRSGYVLDFSNRTFAEFFEDEDIEIYPDKYGFKGASKANHLRAFRETEPDHVVGRVLASLIEHHVPETEGNRELRTKCLEIVARLQASSPELHRLLKIARVADLRERVRVTGRGPGQPSVLH